MELPPGLTSRPLRPDDARAVFEVMAAQEREDTGETVIELADIVADWQRPSFDIASSTIGILDGDRLVAYAELAGDRGDAAVHPEHRGRGIGTALALWMQALGRDRGEPVIGMPVPVGSPGEALLRSLGYQPRWTSWVLRIPADEAVEAQPLPTGYAVRAATQDEWPAVHTVIEDAFAEWSSRPRQDFADFSAQVFRRPGFAPWNLRVATDPDGTVVGAAFVMVDGSGCAYVDKLAVRADRRNRGLARSLLADAFAVARAHGGGDAELSTDTRTGALALYEKVGMRVVSSWVNLGVAP